jgi:hypothetical protein
MDEEPLNEEFKVSLLEGYEADEIKAMKIEGEPFVEDWRSKYLAWID